jgi:hypothetical protein
MGSHRRNQKAAIKKQIPHFAACFRNEQAAVARRAMGCAIPAAVVGVMIGTYAVVSVGTRLRAVRPIGYICPSDSRARLDREAQWPRGERRAEF